MVEMVEVFIDAEFGFALCELVLFEGFDIGAGDRGKGVIGADGAGEDCEGEAVAIKGGGGDVVLGGAELAIPGGEAGEGEVIGRGLVRLPGLEISFGKGESGVDLVLAGFDQAEGNAAGEGFVVALALMIVLDAMADAGFAVDGDDGGHG